MVIRLYDARIKGRVSEQHASVLGTLEDKSDHLTCITSAALINNRHSPPLNVCKEHFAPNTKLMPRAATLLSVSFSVFFFSFQDIISSVSYPARRTHIRFSQRLECESGLMTQQP